MAPTTVLIFSLLFVFVPTTLSQTFGNLPAGPTVSSCGPLLLRLAPCGPFVQGASPSPTERCCSNLRQLYIQQPDCLCLLLNQTGISTLPINTTLALQLPLLCSMHVDNDTCSGSEGLAPRSSTPQVSFGTNNNSSVAASPMVTVPPKTSSTLGFGFNNSSAVNFNAKESLMIMTVLTSWGALFWFWPLFPYCLSSHYLDLKFSSDMICSK